LRYGFGAIYRHNLSPQKESGISIRASFKYSALSFNIDKTGAPAVTIPNVDYAYLEPGLQVTVPLNPQISLQGGGHFYVIQATGEIQDGNQYGGAAVSGFDGEVGASYRFKPKILFNATARYAQFSYLFDGSGDLTDRDGNNQQDVASATDAYLGVVITAGYLY
jgi:hypothetical protein